MHLRGGCTVVGIHMVVGRGGSGWPVVGSGGSGSTVEVAFVGGLVIGPDPSQFIFKLGPAALSNDFTVFQMKKKIYIFALISILIFLYSENHEVQEEKL